MVPRVVNDDVRQRAIRIPEIRGDGAGLRPQPLSRTNGDLSGHPRIDRAGLLRRCNAHKPCQATSAHWRYRSSRMLLIPGDRHAATNGAARRER